MPALTKLCYRCRNLLPVGEFGRDRQKRDGLTSYCRACKADLNAEWFAAHQHQRAQQIDRWKQEHADEVRASDLARKKALYATDPNYREVISKRNAEQYARRKASAEGRTS